MKKDNGLKKIVNIIKELRKTDKGKAILFFGFYFIFFLALIVIIKVSKGMTVVNNNYEEGNKYSFTTTSILANNYHFNYVINIDNRTITYDGDRNNDKELFTLTEGNNSTTYYVDGETFYQKNNATYTKAESPLMFSYFLDNNNIATILKSLTYISKTSYDSGKEQDNFQVSTTTLVKLVSSLDIDISDVSNEASFITDENKNLIEINYNLSSYAKYEQLADNNCRIIIKYSNFGNVKEISK